jgi:hypothetical protein
MDAELDPGVFYIHAKTARTEPRVSTRDIRANPPMRH